MYDKKYQIIIVIINNLYFYF